MVYKPQIYTTLKLHRRHFDGMMKVCASECFNVCGFDLKMYQLTL